MIRRMRLALAAVLTVSAVLPAYAAPRYAHPIRRDIRRDHRDLHHDRRDRRHDLHAK